MPKNEVTSKRVASIASKILRGNHCSKKDVKTVAGSALTQAPDKKKKKK